MYACVYGRGGIRSWYFRVVVEFGGGLSRF